MNPVARLPSPQSTTLIYETYGLDEGVLASDPITLRVDDLGHLEDCKSLLVVTVDVTDGDNAVTCGRGTIDLDQLEAQEGDGNEREDTSHVDCLCK